MSVYQMPYRKSSDCIGKYVVKANYMKNYSQVRFVHALLNMMCGHFIVQT